MGSEDDTDQPGACGSKEQSSQLSHAFALARACMLKQIQDQKRLLARIAKESLDKLHQLKRRKQSCRSLQQVHQLHQGEGSSLVADRRGSRSPVDSGRSTPRRLKRKDQADQGNDRAGKKKKGDHSDVPSVEPDCIKIDGTSSDEETPHLLSVPP